jgi:NAD(P)-dependent dehydrogenase (short-subunit alcohol dehydrogenase family)
VDDLFDVSGLSVFITGGSSGLGLQNVWLFAARGARVSSVATMHDPKVADALSDLNPVYPVAFVSADLRTEDGIKHAFDVAQAAHGTPQVVINSAGISSRKRFLEVGRDDWDALMEINVKAMFFVAQEAASRMIAGNIAGSIINMTSILATKTMTGTSLYSSAKASISQMTKSMAFELAGQGIRVNAIAPGWFETRMTAEFLQSGAKAYLKSVNPMRRLGEPGDLDGAVLLLASNAGRYMTGTILTVDGGQSLSG